MQMGCCCYGADGASTGGRCSLAVPGVCVVGRAVIGVGVIVIVVVVGVVVVLGVVEVGVLVVMVPGRVVVMERLVVTKARCY